MSLRVVVAAPFRQQGRERLSESEFIVAVSLDRDWFSPDQASRVVDRGIGDDLLSREDGELRIEFDPESVEIPPGFEPDEDLLQQASPFEMILDRLVTEGLEKREAVAGINQLQAELDVTVEAAAVVYARRRDVDVTEAARAARTALEGG